MLLPYHPRLLWALSLAARSIRRSLSGPRLVFLLVFVSHHVSSLQSGSPELVRGGTASCSFCFSPMGDNAAAETSLPFISGSPETGPCFHFLRFADGACHDQAFYSRLSYHPLQPGLCFFCCVPITSRPLLCSPEAGSHWTGPRLDPTALQPTIYATPGESCSRQRHLQCPLAFIKLWSVATVIAGVVKTESVRH